MRPIDPSEAAYLEFAIGITPVTVAALHALRLGLAQAWVSGDIFSPRAVVVQRSEAPAEPLAYGIDAGAIWAILRTLEGWTSVNVDPDIARDLRPIMHWYYPRIHKNEVIFHARRGAPTLPPAPADAPLRLLSSADVHLLEKLPIAGFGFGTPENLLKDGIAAGALSGGQLVSIAYVTAAAGRYAEVRAYTDPERRGHGLASRAVWLVMEELEARGHLPVWVAEEQNTAALRIAEKLALLEVSRRVTLTPEPR
jgi:GNAT superfamily N-acetyltransferase